MYERSASPALSSTVPGNMGRSLPSLSSSLLCHCPFSGGWGSIAPPPHCQSRIRVWDLIDRPQRRIPKLRDPTPTPATVLVSASPDLFWLLPPTPCNSRCSVHTLTSDCTLTSDVICKGTWIGLFPLVLTYLDNRNYHQVL